MPLYLARGPATMAFLIRARDRDHLNYILDAELDPGAFEAEVYDGPLALVLSLPASLEGEPAFASPTPDLRVSFRGSTDREALLALPKVAPFDPYEEEWSHLRRRAFPKLGELLDGLGDEAEEGEQTVRAAVEAAIAEDVIAQGRRAFWQEERVEGEERARREQLGVTVALESLLAGGRTHGEWRAEGWADEDDEDIDDEGFDEDEGGLDEDDDVDGADLHPRMREAVERFGEMSLAVTANGVRWRLGNPVVAEGATLEEALERAGGGGTGGG